MNNNFDANNETMLELTDALITRICHDLINPIGTAQMVIEDLSCKEEEKNLLKNCIDQTAEKLDLFRTIFRQNTENEHSITLLYKYIKKNNLQVDVQNADSLKPALIFFLINKMISKSSIIIFEKEIVLQNIRLSEEEIEALEGRSTELNAGNILPFISQLIDGKMQIENQGSHLSWKIKI